MFNKIADKKWKPDDPKPKPKFKSFVNITKILIENSSTQDFFFVINLYRLCEPNREILIHVNNERQMLPDTTC